jgi:hypothetical protein
MAASGSTGRACIGTALDLPIAARALQSASCALPTARRDTPGVAGLVRERSRTAPVPASRSLPRCLASGSQHRQRCRRRLGTTSALSAIRSLRPPTGTPAFPCESASTRCRLRALGSWKLAPITAGSCASSAARGALARVSPRPSKSPRAGLAGRRAESHRYIGNACAVCRGAGGSQPSRLRLVRDLGAELAGRAAGRISLLVLRGRLYASSMRPDSVALRASAMTRP